MIDWNGRIDDLMSFLDREWKISDRDVVEMLLAAMVDCPRTPPLWVVLETPWYDVETRHAWFSFGGLVETASLPRMRRIGFHSEAMDTAQRWLNDPKPLVLVEPEWDKFWTANRLPQYEFVQQRALRLRTPLPKTDIAFRTLDSEDGLKLAAELAHYARKCVSDPTRDRSPNPPKFRLPPDLCYHLELVQKMSPFYRDWNLVAAMVGGMAVRRAHLYGRTETDEDDMRVISRLMADMIPVWVAILIERLCCGPVRTANLYRTMGMGMIGSYRIKRAAIEVFRLFAEGVIMRRKEHDTWTYNERHVMAMRNVIDGFGGLPQARKTLQLADGRKYITAG